MMAYCKWLARFPIKFPWGPQDKLTTFFKEHRLDVEAPPLRAQPRNKLISAPTWVLINKRAALQ